MGSLCVAPITCWLSSCGRIWPARCCLRAYVFLVPAVLVSWCSCKLMMYDQRLLRRLVHGLWTCSCRIMLWSCMCWPIRTAAKGKQVPTICRRQMPRAPCALGLSDRPWHTSSLHHKICVLAGPSLGNVMCRNCCDPNWVVQAGCNFVCFTIENVSLRTSPQFSTRIVQKNVKILAREIPYPGHTGATAEERGRAGCGGRGVSAAGGRGRAPTSRWCRNKQIYIYIYIYIYREIDR